MGKQPSPWGQGAASSPRVVLDAIGREVPASPQPQRIVSLVPSETKALFDLGLGDRLVGCTDYCISPAAGVKNLFHVGGPENVLKIRPDLILANQEENDREQVETLIQCNLRLHLDFPTTVEDAARFLEDLGVLTGAEPLAQSKSTQKHPGLPGAPTNRSGLPDLVITTYCNRWQHPDIKAYGYSRFSQHLQ